MTSAFVNLLPLPDGFTSEGSRFFSASIFLTAGPLFFFSSLGLTIDSDFTVSFSCGSSCFSSTGTSPSSYSPMTSELITVSPSDLRILDITPSD